MKHKDKVKMARKMRTQEETKGRKVGRRVSIFESNAWEKRKRAVQKRIKLKKLRSKK